jgi:hypothetical protein
MDKYLECQKWTAKANEKGLFSSSLFLFSFFLYRCSFAQIKTSFVSCV